MTFWFSAHTHSRYSAKDALPTVERVVERAADLGYPALGLTDHGNMAGSVALYTSCRKVGIEPLPGIEAYVALDRFKGKRPATVHLGMLATTAVGYRNLVGLATLSHANFHYKPVLDLADLAAAADDGRLEGVVALSGCWFGLLPTMLREGDPLAARNLLLALDSWFDQLYVELQHHNIVDETHDDPRHVALLQSLAHNLGLPMVITQDSHYCLPDERADHETMKRLTSWSDDPDDAVFPGDGYHMVDTAWMEDRYPLGVLADGMEGLRDLAGRAKVVIPELDTFTVAVPDIGTDPDGALWEKVEDGLEAKIEQGVIAVTHRKTHLARLAEEADVVATSGMAGYLLLTAEVCDFMRSAGITYNVRGSASGSHLCWMLGITSFNTLKWELPFDRFLSTDRTKMPDIDIDVEHRRRGEVVDYLRGKYHVSHISTWLQMGLEEGETGDQKGSLLVRWKMHARKTGGNPDLRVAETEWRKLQSLAAHKAYMGYGVHAAGLMITPDEATAACVPLQYVASSKTMVTGYGKDDVEALGLVKLDLLGLKTLTALRTASELTGVDWRSVSLKDPAAMKLIRSGRTLGLFQLEGAASARGLKQLKPSRLSDIIAAMALFRPATLKSGATDAYIARRSGKFPVPARHPIIEEATAETYGVLLYQEQVLGIMKTLGLTVEEVERGRKAVKASNENVHGARVILTELRAQMRSLGAAAGLSEADQTFLDVALDAYAGYGFNKAHATSYGLLAYITAYFRANHPAEFWTGMLDAYADSDNEVWYGDYRDRIRVKQPKAYELEARKDGVVIYGPHVNTSKESWTFSAVDRAIRTGLTAIHGVGQVAARELVAHAPYADLSDLATKVSARRVTGSKALGSGHSPLSCGGTVAALSRAGALKGLDATLQLPLQPKPTKEA